ncbi:response regulator transcription factor [Thermicanus aegyptius]|uniref:response regulator transcription factor n=1 Tax=Thermicanus aegyptius TaxID=94009 RepID=UPI0003FA5100|nr:response regulator transcription factor [Thermicanus aegyptius]
MARERIMIVDDDPDIQELIKLYLTQNGYETFSVTEGEKVVAAAKTYNPDLIILDVVMPGVDGIELCQSLRKFTDVPIIFLSARQDEMNKIMGLSTGGDDYVTKPFSMAELLVRIRAHLRRNRILREKIEEKDQEKEENGTYLRFGELEIDLIRNLVMKNGNPIPLSAKEFQILVYLARHPEQIFSQEELYQALWGKESLGDTRTINVHISNLRRKIETDPENPRFILTVRGWGYKLNRE